MITAQEARSMATRITLEEIEDCIRENAKYGTDTTVPLCRWNPDLEPVLAEAGYSVRRGGINDEVVIVEWSVPDEATLQQAMRDTRHLDSPIGERVRD